MFNYKVPQSIAWSTFSKGSYIGPPKIKKPPPKIPAFWEQHHGQRWQPECLPQGTVLLPGRATAALSFFVLRKESLKDSKLQTVCVCIYVWIPFSGNKPKTGGFNKTYQKGDMEEALRFSWYWRWKWWHLLRTRYTESVIITHSPWQSVVITSSGSVICEMFRNVMRPSCHNSACWECPALGVPFAVLLEKCFLETDSFIVEKQEHLLFKHMGVTAIMVSSRKTGWTTVSWNTFYYEFWGLELCLHDFV